MITNERQYEHTNKAANGFREAIEQAKASPPTKKRDSVIAGMRAQLATLDKELRAYAALKASGGRALESTLDDLGLLLTQARVARGWDQKGLAERVQVSEQTIQRYEKTSYQTASLTTLQDVARVLGVQITCGGAMIQLADFSNLKTRRSPSSARAEGQPIVGSMTRTRSSRQ